MSNSNPKVIFQGLENYFLIQGYSRVFKACANLVELYGHPRLQNASLQLTALFTLREILDSPF